MRVRQSPLRSEHEALGAKFVDFGGWEMPLSYPAGTVAEHLACRRDVVAFDVSHLGTVRVTDAEAFTTLQRAFTNDLAKIGPRRTQYTHLLDEQGSVLDDCIIWWVTADRFDVMPNASNTAQVRAAIGGEDVTDSRAVIAVQGPNARAALSRFASDAAGVAHNEVIEFSYRDTICVAAGTGYTGEDGVECAVPSAIAPQFWRDVIASGAAPAGLGARDTLRLEAGLPLHGHELGPGITPLQAGLSWVVAFDKGPFPGREALLAERATGVNRRLRGLLGDSRRPFHAGEEVLLEGRRVGSVTSGNFSPILERGIALALLEPAVVNDTRVTVSTRQSLAPATVVKPPFTRIVPNEQTPKTKE